MTLLENNTKEEKKLILHLLKYGKDMKWIKLAEKFNIRPDIKDKTARIKATNDLWRRFLHKIERRELDLEIVKQTFNKHGEIIFETKKKVLREEEMDSSEFVLEGYTTNPLGKAWKRYRKVKAAEEEFSPAFVFEKLLEKYSGFELNPEVPRLQETNDVIGVLNLYDAHLDKIALKSTTGTDSTLDENIATFKATIERIIPYIIQNKPQFIILPVGNDLFHTNNFGNKTKKGTKIEYLTSPEEAYYAICDVMTDTILRLSQFVDVEVLMIKGNHDEDKITTLGYWLERVFKTNDRINIESTRRQRKYYVYGENLLGFAHGDKEKYKMAQLPLIMATECGQEWGSTTYRKMYLGDLHHGFEYQFLKAKDFPGAEVEYLRSVGAMDSWHSDFGWVGVPRTAYLQIFDKYEGEFNRYKFNIK